MREETITSLRSQDSVLMISNWIRVYAGIDVFVKS